MRAAELKIMTCIFIRVISCSFVYIFFSGNNFTFYELQVTYLDVHVTMLILRVTGYISRVPSFKVHFCYEKLRFFFLLVGGIPGPLNGNFYSPAMVSEY